MLLATSRYRGCYYSGRRVSGPIVVGALAWIVRAGSRLGLGILPLLVGLAFFAIASVGRDLGRRDIKSGKATSLGQALLGVTLAFLSGFLSAMLNVGFALGNHLEEIANSLGYSPYLATMAVWLPIVVGGSFANFGYPA